MKITMEWSKAGDLLAQAQRVLILTHIGPDGDAIGSLLGLAHGLTHLGKAVITAVDGGVPEDLAFLPGAATVRPALDGVAMDLTIAVDCGDVRMMGQVGQAALASGVPLINLDHHATNTLYGQANLVDATTVAAAEGVLNWLDQLGVALDQATATCLLTGIVTDTLCFRTDRVTSETLGKAQRLMELGAALPEIVQRTVSRVSYSQVRLWGQAMPTVQHEEHVIWAVITQAMFQAADFPEVDDANLVSFLVQADEAYIAVVFKEKPDGAVEIGMRAVPGFDVSVVAAALGGGGHQLASGATVREPLETLVPRVVGLLQGKVRLGAPAVR